MGATAATILGSLGLSEGTLSTLLSVFGLASAVGSALGGGSGGEFDPSQKNFPGDYDPHGAYTEGALDFAQTDEEERDEIARSLAQAAGIPLSRARELVADVDVSPGLRETDSEEEKIEAQAVASILEQLGQSPGGQTPGLPKIPDLPTVPDGGGLPAPAPAPGDGARILTGVPGQIVALVKKLAPYLARYPRAAKWLAVKLGFSGGSDEHLEFTDLRLCLLLDQLPGYMLDAIVQYKSGLAAPLALSSAGEQAFLMLLLADSRAIDDDFCACRIGDICDLGD